MGPGDWYTRRAFRTARYIARLSLDGELSDAEKRHLNIVKKIFESRVGILKSSREQFVSILGQ
jgi:hypothetical protein